MGVPPVIIHFRLGCFPNNHPAIGVLPWKPVASGWVWPRWVWDGSGGAALFHLRIHGHAVLFKVVPECG